MTLGGGQAKRRSKAGRSPVGLGSLACPPALRCHSPAALFFQSFPEKIRTRKNLRQPVRLVGIIKGFRNNGPILILEHCRR
jgi:hypothetical protein